ncbi:MAG: potassium transporter TrkH [Deltaproteobacteria bacterium]|nr:potassium transporter TrkH [Deltaproteobacteria bacterium]
MKADELFSRPLRSLDEPADLSASQLLVLSFLGLVTVGWLGFLFLPGLYEGEPLGWVDALFISASAVCVTGLTTIDVPNVLSFWGELWLLALIQAGALGILTFAALVVAAVGRRSGLDVQEATSDFSAILPTGSARQMLWTIIGFTLTVEAIGAAALFAQWYGDFGPARGAWLSVFHAVSAFGNAGFSLFSDNLMGQQSRPLALLTIGALIVAGGLGFPVIQDLRMRARDKRRRLTTHTRLAVGATLVLVLGGAGFFLFFEWNRELATMGFVDRVANALFMSITPRTAGFNTVDYDGITNASLFLTFVLMWIGGAPASTAGGAKVTTATLLALVLWARLKGDATVSIAGRTIPAETVNRATGLAVGMVLILMAFLTLLVAFEPALDPAAERTQLVRLAFEVQSALSTVGLSMNLTPALADGSKLTLVVVMLLGRVGPLAVLGAMALRSHRTVWRYAHEDILIG